MHFDISKSDFNKTLMPWLGTTLKMMNTYIADVFQENNIQLTKQQWIVLKLLFENTEGIIQNKLAFITNRNKASLTRLINVMEKNNLVTRISSEKDARKKLIHITEKGKSLFLKTRPIMFNCLENVEKGISKDERDLFIQIMTKIQYNLKNNKIT